MLDCGAEFRQGHVCLRGSSRSLFSHLGYHYVYCIYCLYRTLKTVNVGPPFGLINNWRRIKPLSSSSINFRYYFCVSMKRCCYKLKGTVSRDFRLLVFSITLANWCQNFPPISLRPVPNLPPVSLILVVHLDLRIFPQIFKKNWNGPNGIFRSWGETNSWKKPEAKNLVTLSL